MRGLHQELVIRGLVSMLILVFNEAHGRITGQDPNGVIRVSALLAVLVNGPYYLSARTGRCDRLQAYGRLLADIAFTTVGLYGRGGLAAAQYLGIYTIVPIYAGMVFSAAACVLAIGLATVSFLALALLQHGGWILTTARPRPDAWTVAAFNLLLVNVIGLLAASLGAAYRQRRQHSAARYRDLEQAHEASLRLCDELRVAQERLQRRQIALVQRSRLAAVREMAAGVAHKFNNVLAVIIGRTQLLERRISDPEVKRALAVVSEAAWDGAQTVRSLQEFTRTRPPRLRRPVDLQEVLRAVVQCTRPRWSAEAARRGVQYQIRVDGEAVSPVAGSAEQLHEVFTNLLDNARDAMPCGGCCVIDLQGDAESAVVSVRDSGVGMSEAIRSRAFEPFFTTKGPAAGGLGLAVAWGIVTGHGGTIEIESTMGRGTTVRVRLPIRDAFSAKVKSLLAPPLPDAPNPPQ
jgi:signal transduction histidine kinase